MELRVESDVSLYDGENKVQSAGTVTLTTHRVLYQKEAFKAGFLLESISDIQERSPWIGKSKIILYFLPGKFVMMSIPRFPQFKTALRDAVDSRKKAVTEPASRSTAITRPLNNAGIGAVLKMKVSAMLI